MPLFSIVALRRRLFHMRHSLPACVCTMIMLLVLAGCTTTKSMVSGAAADPKLTVEEKFEALGFPEMETSYPILYQNGPEWRDRLTELVEQAEDYVILVAFLASECDENQALYDAICRKAEEGVDVWLLIDGTSSFDMTESRYQMRTLGRLRDHGVKLFEYNPISIDRLVGTVNLLYREHRKIVVIDGMTAVIGGMNINYISMGDSTSAAKGQRDMMFEVVSPELCSYLVDDFITVWNQLSWEEIPEGSLAKVDSASRLIENPVTAWYADQSERNNTMPSLYGSLINSAEKSIALLPFLPYCDKFMLEALRNAVARGVEVTMIMPFDSRPGNRKASQYMVKDILETGVEVRRENESEEFLPLLHEKLMVVDDLYTVVGSCNFNYRSMNLSSEVVMVVKDEAFASQMTEHFDKLKDNTRPISAEEADSWRNVSSFISFLGGFYGG